MAGVRLCYEIFVWLKLLVYFFPYTFLFLMKRTSGVGSGVGVFLAIAASFAKNFPLE